MPHTISRYLFVTNRGPVQLGHDGETLVRSGGGLASGLLGLMEAEGGSDIRWLFPISAPAELTAAREGIYQRAHPGFCPAPVSALDHEIAYEVIANQYFWYLFHGLFDLSFEPIFDHRFFEAYDHYRAFNAQIAHEICKLDLAETIVVINDYHLMLVPQLLRAQDFDGPIVLFFHTPICTGSEAKLIPAVIRSDLVESFGATNLIGLHAHQWEQNLQDSFGSQHPKLPPTVVAPLPPDTDGIRHSLTDPAIASERAQLESLAMGLPVILRVDRIEPSKNLLRGVYAIDEMLTRHRDMVASFRALFFAYPSRGSVPKYQRLARELQSMVEEINERWRHNNWVPIHLDLSDHPGRSLAGYQLFDTLLVNPLRDGLNLVVFEAALSAKPSAQIVLSTQTGAAEHVGEWLELIDPLDIGETAEALVRSLNGGHLAPIRTWIEGNTWQHWLQRLHDALV